MFMHSLFLVVYNGALNFYFDKQLLSTHNLCSDLFNTVGLGLVLILGVNLLVINLIL